MTRANHSRTSAPLFDAIAQGNLDAVRRVLDGGVDLRVVEPKRGWGPLHVAIEAIDAEGAPVALLELLIGRGANVNAWDEGFDSTPRY